MANPVFRRLNRNLSLLWTVAMWVAALALAVRAF